MARTNIDIDDQACERVMRQYGLRTKREAVNLALRNLAVEPMSLDEHPTTTPLHASTERAVAAA